VESPPVVANGGVENGARGGGAPEAHNIYVTSSGVQLTTLQIQKDATLVKKSFSQKLHIKNLLNFHHGLFSLLCIY
jgi:hypothetical protein